MTDDLVFNLPEGIALVKYDGPVEPVCQFCGQAFHEGDRHVVMAQDGSFYCHVKMFVRYPKLCAIIEGIE